MTPLDERLRKIAWETMNPGQVFSTANSDINVIYWERQIMPVVRKMYELGFVDGEQHTVESRVTQHLEWEQRNAT